MKPKLYLMLGYPGAGKTTTAETLAKLTGATHLSSDRFRLAMYKSPQFDQAEHDAVYGALDYLTEELLKSGVSLIYDANLNRYIHRQDKYDICRRTGAEPVLLWVQVDEELARQRATIDAEDDPRRPYGNLGTDVFSRLVTQIEPPHPDEPTVNVDGTKVSEAYIKALLGI